VRCDLVLCNCKHSADPASTTTRGAGARMRDETCRARHAAARRDQTIELRATCRRRGMGASAPGWCATPDHPRPPRVGPAVKLIAVSWRGLLLAWCLHCNNTPLRSLSTSWPELALDSTPLPKPPNRLEKIHCFRKPAY
jgi:hypothetical protein